MCPQQKIVFKIKRIVHCPGGMVFGNIERFEIMIVIFNLRTIDNLKTYLHEQLLDVCKGLGNRVQSTGALSPWR